MRPGRANLLLMMLTAAIAGGCASREGSSPAASTSGSRSVPDAPGQLPAEQLPVERAPAVASALAFTPSLVRVSPPLDLDRAGRDQAAYIGYEPVRIERLYVRQDDRFRNDTHRADGRFERRAISTKIVERVR